jgi:hypothetical protein
LHVMSREIRYRSISTLIMAEGPVGSSSVRRRVFGRAVHSFWLEQQPSQ